MHVKFCDDVDILYMVYGEVALMLQVQCSPTSSHVCRDKLSQSWTSLVLGKVGAHSGLEKAWVLREGDIYQSGTK